MVVVGPDGEYRSRDSRDIRGTHCACVFCHHLQRDATCDRDPPPADSDRASGSVVKRKRNHVLTYLGKVVAVSSD